VSDFRSQQRGLEHRRSRQSRLGADPDTPPWRHLGTSRQKYGRLRAALRRLAREFHDDAMSSRSLTLAADLLHAATEPWLLELIWDWSRDPGRHHERTPGNSGLTLADLERWDSRWDWCRMLGDYVVPMAPYMQDTSAAPVRCLPVKPDALPVRQGDCYGLWEEKLKSPFMAMYRRVYLTKPGSRKRRPIDVAESWDWLIEKAIQIVVRDLLTVGLPPSALAYRDGVGTEHGLAKAVATAKARDLHHWLSLDLADAYGTVVHPRLEGVLDTLIPNAAVVRLIMQTLSPARRADGKTSGTPRGLPQGSPLSPFVFNCFAARFIDQPWRKRFPQWPMFRYGDDLVVLTGSKREAREAHYHLRAMIIAAGCAVQTTKTRLVDMDRQSLVWLGYEIRRCGGRYEAAIPEKTWEELGQTIRECRPEERGELFTQTIPAFFDFNAPAWESRHLEAAVSRLEDLLAEAGHADRLTEEARRQKQNWKDIAGKASKRWTGRLADVHRTEAKAVVQMALLQPTEDRPEVACTDHRDTGLSSSRTAAATPHPVPLVGDAGDDGLRPLRGIDLQTSEIGRVTGIR
jgi:hypothetical protein